ncbi:MAG: glycosyltransferase family 39 protein [Anaerolineae bacterium]|nr:glycosyltransferase family 39 protein [Anaerolineae bacterium]
MSRVIHFLKSIRTSFKHWHLGLIFALIIALTGLSTLRTNELNYAFTGLQPIFEEWNDTYYLSFEHPFNALAGIFLILLAIGLFGRFLSQESQSFSVSHSGFSTETLALWRKSRLWISLGLVIYTIAMWQVADHQSSPIWMWMWLAAFGIFTFLFWKHENNATPSLAITDWIWVLSLLAFAIAVGAYLLNDFPAGWIADELPFWGTAKDIVNGKLNPPFFDFGVFTFPVASSFLQAWVMSWAGVDFWGWRFASVLPAAFTVVPLYLLANELFDRQTAVLASILMVVNPYFLAFARLGYNNSQSLFPVTLAVYFLVIGLKNKNRFFLWLAGISAGLGFYTYFAAWLGLVILVLVFLSFFLHRSINKLENTKLLVFVLMGALAVILPRVLYGLSSDTASTLHYKVWETGPINTFYGKLVFGDEVIAQAHVFKIAGIEVFYDLQLYAILFIRGVLRTFAVLFDPIGYSDHQIFFGLTGIGSSLFFIIGLGVSFSNFKKFNYFLLLLWFLAGFFFLGILASIPPRPTHMVAILPALALLSAIGLTSLVRSLTPESALVRHIAVVSITSVLVLTSLFQFYFLVPYAFAPANEDDYISWLGRQIPEPANLYLIDHIASTRNPEDETLKKLSQHQVISLTIEDLGTNTIQPQKWDNFVAFISPRNGREFAEQLSSQIPGSVVQIAYAPGKRLRGFVVTDLNINTEMEIGLGYGIIDLWNSPARSLILSCIAGILLLVFFKKRSENITLKKIYREA